MHDWLDLLECIPQNRRESSFELDVAFSGSVQAANALVFAEEERPPGGRHWDIVLSTLAEAEERAERLGVDILWAAFRAARMTIYGERQRDLQRATEEANGALARELSSESRWLITKTMGLLYVDLADYAGAEPWLLAAVESRTNAAAGQYVAVAIWAAVAVGARDPNAAAEVAETAVAYAEEILQEDDLMIVTALVEAGLAHWLAGDRSIAVARWHTAGERLFPRADLEPEAAAPLITMLYVLAFASAVTRYGARPVVNGEKYQQPGPGVMLRARRVTDTPASPMQLAMLAHLLADLAAAVGADTVSALWAERGIQLAEGANDTATAAVLLPTLVADRLSRGEEEAVLRSLLEGGRALHLEHTTSRGEGVSNALDMSISARTIGPAADYHAAVYGLLPLALRLAALAAEEAPDLLPATISGALACRTVADESGDPATWRLAAEVIERGFRERAPARELIAMVDQASPADDQLASALRSVAYLAASLDPGFLPA